MAKKKELPIYLRPGYTGTYQGEAKSSDGTSISMQKDPNLMRRLDKRQKTASDENRVNYTASDYASAFKNALKSNGIDIDAGKKGLQSMGRTKKAASGAAASGANAARPSIKPNTSKPNTSKAVSGGGVKVGSGKSSNSVKNVGGDNSKGNKNMESRKGKKTWNADAELARRRQESQIAKYEKAFGRKINKGWR